MSKTKLHPFSAAATKRLVATTKLRELRQIYQALRDECAALYPVDCIRARRVGAQAAEIFAEIMQQEQIEDKYSAIAFKEIWKIPEEVRWAAKDDTELMALIAK